MMELREQIARAIHGRRTTLYDVSWSDWLPEADAALEALAQQKPVARVVRNMSGQIRIEGAHGNAFDLLSHLGADLYLTQGAQVAGPDGWLRAVDEEMAAAHLGVANAGDDYYEAKAKLNSLICWHVAVATDPAVNGGWRLVPTEPTAEMCHVYGVTHFETGSHREALRAALAAAPKPEER